MRAMTERSVVLRLLQWLHRPIYRHRITTLVRLMAPCRSDGDRVLEVGYGSVEGIAPDRSHTSHSWRPPVPLAKGQRWA